MLAAASDSRNSTNEIRATAPPPTPLNSATICGIAVIFTERAAGTPTAVPMRDAERDQAVVADLRLDQQRRDTAIAMPIAPQDVALPRRARVVHEPQVDDEQRKATM